MIIPKPGLLDNRPSFGYAESRKYPFIPALPGRKGRARKKLAVYIAVSFGLAWGICLFLYLSGSWMMTAALSTGLALCML